MLLGEEPGYYRARGGLRWAPKGYASQVHNAEVLFREDASVDEFIDIIEGNRKYSPRPAASHRFLRAAAPGSSRPTSAPGPGSPRPTSAPGLAS